MENNFEINKKKILDDYYKCLGAFYNCSILYEQLEKLKINENIPKEIKKGMEEDLLSNLGKVGEKAFKYIIGLENIKLYPNQDSASFEALWKKSNALKEFAKKHGIKENDEEFIKLINYHDDNNQKAHNFDYWYSVIDLTMKEVSEKFKTFIEYTIQSETLIEDCKEDENFKNTFISNYEDINEISLPFRAAIFPNILELNYEYIHKVPDFQINWLMEANRKAIQKHGDIFTRLRYASNNVDNQTFNLNQAYDLINKIVTFIQMIHESNDNLDFDLVKMFAKYKSLEFSELLNISKEEIENLFTLDLSGEELALTLYETDYSYNSIKGLLDIGIPKSELRKVMRERLRARTIVYFKSMGVTDYKKMRELLDYYNKHGKYPDQSLKLKK